MEYKDVPAWKAVLQRHKVAASSSSKKSSPSSFSVCLFAFLFRRSVLGFCLRKNARDGSKRVK